ncbi:MAG: SemiSWEET transporter [Bryocella sp.]
MTPSKSTIDIIGYCAATLTTISFLPQLMRVIELRSAREISLVMFLTLTLGTGMWLLYGLSLHAMPIILANSVTLALSLAILFCKLRFDKHATDPLPHTSAPQQQ